MKDRILKLIFCLTPCLTALNSKPALADFWGGDLPLLLQIVTNTANQLIQLRQILGNGKDTLSLLEEVNRGIKEAAVLRDTANRTLSAGNMSGLGDVGQILSAIESQYGRIPNTPMAASQAHTDQSVAEAINLNNESFKYAAMLDEEAEKIKSRAPLTNPQGAQRLTAQSMGVLINVMGQLLRTNARMVKLQGEELAMRNRSDKLSSEQFQRQYSELSTALGNAPSNYDLPSLSR